MQIVDFLDETFNLDKSVYKPFCKENNNPIYINIHSNHPHSILRKLPQSIEKLIPETLSDEDIFDKSIKNRQESKM